MSTGITLPSEVHLRNRLLIVGLSSDYGGTETYILSLTRLICGQTRIHVLCANEVLAQKLEAAGISTTRLTPRSGIGKIHQVTTALREFLKQWRAGNVDTLLVNGYSEIGLLPVARLLRCRAIATRHLSFQVETSNLWQSLSRHSARILYQVLSPTASLIIAVSHAVASDVLRYCPVSAAKLIVIPNWVDEIPVSTSPRIFHVKEPVRLLYVGRLVDFKGLAILLAALRRIIEQQLAGRSVALDVVGIGPDMNHFQALSLGLPVAFYGMRNDVPKFYDRADIFVNPSHGPEGMPLVTLEAMAHGLPCVLSDLPVHLEVAGDGTSLIYCHHDEESLITQLVALISDPELRGELSRRSLAKISANHSARRARTAYNLALGF